MSLRILVRGNGLAAMLFARLAMGGPHEVALEGSGDPSPDLGLLLDEAAFADLERVTPDLVERAGLAWREWDHIEVRRRGVSTRLATDRTRAMPESSLTSQLTSQVLARGVGVAGRRFEPHLIVAADGAASPTRLARERTFDPVRIASRNRVLVAEVDLRLPCPIVSLRQGKDGLYHAVLTPIDRARAAVTIEAVGAPDAPVEALAKLFAEDLEGRGLRVCAPWAPATFFQAGRRVGDGIVLLGRAAATAHYALGADARLELEDAVALYECLRDGDDLDAALACYQERRCKAADRLQRASDATRHWCENLPLYDSQDAEQFAFGLLTRHHRLDYEKAAALNPDLVRSVETWLAARCGLAASVPPMFLPFRIKDLELSNRVVFSPMAMRQGTREGMPTDFHLVHLGSRAMGGAGLVFGEMTNVSPEGRISHSCVGLYRPEHVEAWRRIVDFVHAQSAAKVALQLGHAGRKGSTRRAPDGRNVPLEEEGWQLLSASAIPWSARAAVPKEADRADMDKIVADYVWAARQGLAIGFDLLDIHMAHGYLLSSFISPLSNRRSDDYGGSLENRMRFPLEVLAAVRAVWPAEKPLSVRISAYDWRPDGLSLDEAVRAAAMLKEAGCDLLTVSSGHTSSGVGAGPEHGRLYQLPFSDRIRNTVGIPTIAVGTIFSWGDVNTIVASGRADLCAIGRGHLYDPYFTRHAAYAQGYELPWPRPYFTAARFKPHRFV